MLKQRGINEVRNQMPDISGFIEHFPYIGLFTLLILGGIGIPFPEDATLISCGFLISHGIVRPIPALIVVYSGLILADISLYSIGKKYGRMIFTHKRIQSLISPERLSLIEKKFNKNGSIVIFFGRHLMGLRVQIFLAAGILKMSILKFIAADAVSSLFTIALMVGIGYAGGNSLQIIKRDIYRIEHMAIFLFLLSLAILLIYRYFKSFKDKISF